MNHFTFGLLAVLILFQHALAAEWEYTGTHGPDHWGGVCESGKSQSPIDIVQSGAQYDDSLGEFSFHGYSDTAANFSMINNGHTVQVNIAGGDYSISGGGLDGSYKLGQFHFHWGSANDKGSEHFVNSKAYPMEVHFVHYASKYADIGASLGDPKGLAVLGFFFEIGNENPTFKKITDRISGANYKSKTTTVDKFALMALLPTPLTTYYRYSGSLTTPTCNEAVVWTVFDKTIKISQAQMDAFRGVKGNEQDEADHVLVDNFRPVQPLNDRTVHSSWTIEAGLAAPPPGVTLTVLALSSLMATLLM